MIGGLKTGTTRKLTNHRCQNQLPKSKTSLRYYITNFIKKEFYTKSLKFNVDFKSTCCIKILSNLLYSPIYTYKLFIPKNIYLMTFSFSCSQLPVSLSQSSLSLSSWPFSWSACSFMVLRLDSWEKKIIQTIFKIATRMIIIL